MRSLLLIFTFILVSNISLYPQSTIPPTDSMIITGKVKKTIIFTLADIDRFSQTAIRDQIIYNHKGEVKDTLTKLRGVSIKNILSSLQYVYESPKFLNEYYFEFVASDGYKVVFSWNEIYNTEVGNQCFIITEMGEKKLKDLSNRIMFISTSDINTGRRYIKGLQKILVRQLD